MLEKKYVINHIRNEESSVLRPELIDFKNSQDRMGQASESKQDRYSVRLDTSTRHQRAATKNTTTYLPSKLKHGK